MASLAALAEAAANGADTGGRPLAALQLVQLMQLSNATSEYSAGNHLASTEPYAQHNPGKTLEISSLEQASKSDVQQTMCREVGSRAVEAWTARLAAASLAHSIPGLWEEMGRASSLPTSWREDAVAQLQVLAAAGIELNEAK